MFEQTSHASFVGNRWAFLGCVAAWPLMVSFGGSVVQSGQIARRTIRILFTSQGRTGIVNVDGGGLRYFDFNKPGQTTWQPGVVSRTDGG
jgi:hypothetical protein